VGVHVVDAQPRHEGVHPLRTELPDEPAGQPGGQPPDRGGLVVGQAVDPGDVPTRLDERVPQQPVGAVAHHDEVVGVDHRSLQRSLAAVLGADQAARVTHGSMLAPRPRGPSRRHRPTAPHDGTS
jgi:hypothetical protein